MRAQFTWSINTNVLYRYWHIPCIRWTFNRIDVFPSMAFIVLAWQQPLHIFRTLLMKHKWLYKLLKGFRSMCSVYRHFLRRESKMSKVVGLDFLNAGIALLCKIAVCNWCVTHNSKQQPQTRNQTAVLREQVWKSICEVCGIMANCISCNCHYATIHSTRTHAPTTAATTTDTKSNLCLKRAGLKINFVKCCGIMANFVSHSRTYPVWYYATIHFAHTQTHTHTHIHTHTTHTERKR